ncbi:MAG: L-arabinose isomerase [Clostridiales bacterium]|nr:L-arabinose isomerase [Clostridiales bacterium]
MKKVYFLTGSQFLYGEETLKQVEKDSVEMVSFLNEKTPGAEIVFSGVMKTSDEITSTIKKVNFDDECIGIIVWCHTFSPAKMWINGLKILNKPMLHLHTQANEKLPYDEIDMDFMNLNQSAHGDREFAHILTRLGIPRYTVVGYYKKQRVIDKINKWISVANALDFSKQVKICRFGDNMREVAVTDGDKVAANIQFGWQTDYYAVGDIVSEIAKVTDAETDELYNEIIKKYDLNTDNIQAVKEQVKYEIALRRFLDRGNYTAVTTNFQDLYGLRQLFGMSIQRLMESGYGFGAEGDWKIAALTAILKKMAEGKDGGTAFMEDYTYDYTDGEELVLGAHMLEVCPSVAANKPKIEVHPLGIGDKEDPARLVFDGITGDAVAVCMTDMGDRFRIICADIELVKQPKEMPNLPVARIMWKIKPDFETGVKAWLEAGGAHHTVVSTALDREDIELFARLTGAEFVAIG